MIQNTCQRKSPLCGLPDVNPSAGIIMEIWILVIFLCWLFWKYMKLYMCFFLLGFHFCEFFSFCWSTQTKFIFWDHQTMHIALRNNKISTKIRITILTMELYRWWKLSAKKSLSLLCWMFWATCFSWMCWRSCHPFLAFKVLFYYSNGVFPGKKPLPGLSFPCFPLILYFFSVMKFYQTS